MLYHTAIGHLFRPMLKIDLINFKLRPRDACIQAANNVSELLRQYRSFYPMRTCQLVLTHILLSNCIVHLSFSKEPTYASSSYRYLVEGLQGLEDLSICHWFGARAFRIIYEASKAWSLEFPEELRNSKLIPKPRVIPVTSKPSIPAPRLNTAVPSRMKVESEHSPVPSSAISARRESLSMFAHPIQQPPSHPATSQANILRTQTQTHRPRPHIVQSYSPSSVTTPQDDVPVTHAPQTTGSAETLFWNPLPNMAGMGVPILPRNSYPVGPMDLDNMLGSSNEWDRFGRDGFKMSENWNHDQSNAYDGNSHQGYQHGSGEHVGYSTAEVPHYSESPQMSGHVPGVQDGAGHSFDASWWSGQGNMGR